MDLRENDRMFPLWPLWWFPEIGLPLVHHPFPNGIFPYKPTILRDPHDYGNPHQWEFQDPKMELLYHIRQCFVGRCPEK